MQRFAPEIEWRVRTHLRPTGRTWRVDEMYIRVGGGWRYLYRAVDGAGQTVEFLLSAARDDAAARRFFVRALGGGRLRAPRTVVTDRLAGYRAAPSELKRDGRLPEATRHRRGCWLNNRVEQDHRRIERRTRPMLGFKRFATPRRALAGIEAMAMLAKGRGVAWPGRTLPRSAPSCTASSASPPERQRGRGVLCPTNVNATKPSIPHPTRCP